MAYPDTQAEVSVTNSRDDVVRIHPRQAKLQGLLGKPQVAQYADLAFRLRTDTGKMLRLHLRNPGLFLPQAKEILLAHQDLEDAGVRVFGLWRVCFPPYLVRPGRRLPVQGLSEGSLGYRDRLPAWRGPGTGLKLCHQGYQKSKRNLVYGIWSQ